MRTLALLLLVLPLAPAAEICPAGTAIAEKGSAGELQWLSYARRYPRARFCIGNRISSTAGTAMHVEWPDGGIARASLAGALAVDLCCFDREAVTRGSLRYGHPPRIAAVSTHQPAEEGAEGHNEGYPDLLEDDARISTIAIRGTLWDGERPLRVDLLLRCSASQFAKEYAYQFTIEDRSPDEVRVEWDLLRDLRARITPNVQHTRFSRTYVFLSPAEPREASGSIEIRGSTGKLAGTFQAGGFTAGEK